MLLGALLMACQSVCLKVYQESGEWWDFSSITYIKPQTEHKTEYVYMLFFKKIVLGKGHVRTFLFIVQCDGSVVISSFFSEQREEQVSEGELLFNPILCHVSCSSQSINELGSCVKTSVIVSQIQKQWATVKSKQIFVTCTRIFRNFCKCITWSVFNNVYYLGRSQEAGMLPQFYSLSSGGPQLHLWCGTNCELSISETRDFEIWQISSENSHIRRTWIKFPTAVTA